LPHWLVWKWRRNRNGNGWTKPPFRAAQPDEYAESNDPKTWASHHDAVSAVLAARAHGIGFAITNTDIGAIDLDKCRDKETSAIDAWAQAILDAATNAYHEITPSGEGLRIGTATGADTQRLFPIYGARPRARIEVYRRTTRYITISGKEISHCTNLVNIDHLIDNIVVQHEAQAQERTNANGAILDISGIDDIDNIIKFGVPEGQRSEVFHKVVWSLAGQGLTADEIEAELRRYPDGIPKKYINRLGRAVESCYTKWLQHNQTKNTSTASSSHTWDDPDWSILDDRRGELPDFPVDVFTPPWREWLLLASHGAGGRPEHVAVPLLGVASSLIGTARRVRASRSWSEPMTLWTCIVADSGDRKTPGLNVTLRALDLIEKNNSAESSAKRIKHETKGQKAKEIQKKWKEVRQEALDANPPKEPPPMPIDAIDPGNFIEPRLYATDSTIERLAPLLQARPRGMMLIHDELHGLFANITRYSGGNDRPFWLEAWMGNRRVVERVSGSIVVDHLLVGVIGTFQPDKLARAFAGDEDGMYARFLYAWPLAPEYRPLTMPTDNSSLILTGFPLLPISNIVFHI
jgi:hypothetical protein